MAGGNKNKAVKKCKKKNGKLIVWVVDSESNPLVGLKVMAVGPSNANTTTTHSSFRPKNKAIAHFGLMTPGSYDVFVDGQRDRQGHLKKIDVTAANKSNKRNPQATLTLPLDVVTPVLDVPKKLLMIPHAAVAGRDATDPDDPTGTPTPQTMEVSFQETKPGAKFDQDGELTRSADNLELYSDAKCTTKVPFASNKLTLKNADLKKDPKLKYYIKGTAPGECELSLSLKDPGKPSVFKVAEPAMVKLAVVQTTLDLHLDSKASATGALSATDKKKAGRLLHVQTTDKDFGRAQLVVKKPDDSLWTSGGTGAAVQIDVASGAGGVSLFAAETGGSAVALPIELKEKDFASGDVVRWVEGTNASASLRLVQLYATIKSPDAVFDDSAKKALDWVCATVVKIDKVTPDTDDYKQFVNLTADPAKPEQGRDYKVKVHLSTALKDIAIGILPDPDAGNKTGLKASEQHKAYTGSDKIEVKTDGTGVAESSLQLSAYGGDKFVYRAFPVLAPNHKAKAPAESKTATVWRRMTYNSVFTMSGQTYIDAATTIAQIEGAYKNPCFVDYHRGTVTSLAASLTVKYIGLYKKGGGTKTWPGDFSPANLESTANELEPTASELTDYAGSDATKKAAAKSAIEAKAALWFTKIVSDYGTCVSDWFADASVPGGNSLLAVQYYHPKLSGIASDGNTSFWPAGISINLANPGSGLNTPGDPDGIWRNVQGFNRGSTSVVFKNYGTAARLQIVCRHEIGHATKSLFGRDSFGTGDHSGGGLMTPWGASNLFSISDANKVRGFKT